MASITQKITPFLWFDKEAEEAAKFYVSVFPNSKITRISRYSAGGPGPEGSVMTVGFELDGQPFTGINGGPVFKFTEAISFVVNCADQAEINSYWDKLTADGGKEVQCGWLKDRFGLSWQIVPALVFDLIGEDDQARSGRVMAAMMQMVKLDLAKLEAAAKG